MATRAGLDIHVGTVTDFDDETGAGLVQDDDGRILLVNERDVLPCDAAPLCAGRRVHFLEEETNDGPRAIILRVFEGMQPRSASAPRALHAH